MKYFKNESRDEPICSRPESKKVFHMQYGRDGKSTRDQPAKDRKGSRRKNFPRRMLKNKRKRRLRCDCGKPAVTVVTLWVGIEPQYLIKLPLCSECLALENSLKSDSS